MSETIAAVIAGGDYVLADMVRKINTLWVEGQLTDKQREDLLVMAAENANPEGERPGTQEMLETLAGRLEELEGRVAALEGAPETPEYPAWKPWDGMSKDYPKGAVVSHKGELWKSVFEGQNVWEPGTAGTENLWVKYTPENN